MSAVAGTNYCYIGMAVDEERHSLVVMAVLDSVGKGGAHVAIENLNIMAGFARTAGFLDRGGHPLEDGRRTWGDSRPPQRWRTLLVPTARIPGLSLAQQDHESKQ